MDIIGWVQNQLLSCMHPFICLKLQPRDDLTPFLNSGPIVSSEDIVTFGSILVM